MPKFLIRVVSLLLVPCLAADPLLAAGSWTRLNTLVSTDLKLRHGVIDQTLFQEQAIVGPVIRVWKFILAKPTAPVAEVHMVREVIRRHSTARQVEADWKTSFGKWFLPLSPHIGLAVLGLVAAHLGHSWLGDGLMGMAMVPPLPRPKLEIKGNTQAYVLRLLSIQSSPPTYDGLVGLIQTDLNATMNSGSLRPMLAPLLERGLVRKIPGKDGEKPRYDLTSLAREHLDKILVIYEASEKTRLRQSDKDEIDRKLGELGFKPGSPSAETNASEESEQGAEAVSAPMAPGFSGSSSPNDDRLTPRLLRAKEKRDLLQEVEELLTNSREKEAEIEAQIANQTQKVSKRDLRVTQLNSHVQSLEKRKEQLNGRLHRDTEKILSLLDMARKSLDHAKIDQEAAERDLGLLRIKLQTQHKETDDAQRSKDDLVSQMGENNTLEKLNTRVSVLQGMVDKSATQTPPPLVARLPESIRTVLENPDESTKAKNAVREWAAAALTLRNAKKKLTYSNLSDVRKMTKPAAYVFLNPRKITPEHLADWAEAKFPKPSQQRAEEISSEGAPGVPPGEDLKISEQPSGNITDEMDHVEPPQETQQVTPSPALVKTDLLRAWEKMGLTPEQVARKTYDHAAKISRSDPLGTLHYLSLTERHLSEISLKKLDEKRERAIENLLNVIGELRSEVEANLKVQIQEQTQKRLRSTSDVVLANLRRDEALEEVLVRPLVDSFLRGRYHDQREWVESVVWPEILGKRQGQGLAVVNGEKAEVQEKAPTAYPVYVIESQWIQELVLFKNGHRRELNPDVRVGLGKFFRALEEFHRGNLQALKPFSQTGDLRNFHVLTLGKRRIFFRVTEINGDVAIIFVAADFKGNWGATRSGNYAGGFMEFMDKFGQEDMQYLKARARRVEGLTVTPTASSAERTSAKKPPHGSGYALSHVSVFLPALVAWSFGPTAGAVVAGVMFIGLGVWLIKSLIPFISAAWTHVRQSNLSSHFYNSMRSFQSAA